MNRKQFNTVDFKVTLTVGECNGFMNSRWFANDTCMAEIAPSQSGDLDVEFSISLPCVIRIELSNKNLETDTVINSDGAITQDKFIMIKNMWLARRPIPDSIFMNMCDLKTVNDNFKTAYFGFPGVVTICFDEKDPIIWHFKYNHYKVS
jgi:hypothetical protein